MIISEVKIQNFRCLDEYVFRCNKKTSMIVGENGVGKTSILEAIYLALRGKSFRAVDNEMLQRGADNYRVELSFFNGRKSVVFYDGERKIFYDGDKKTARILKKNKYPVILFVPDDLHLVATSPTNRRKYFDRLISEIDEEYSSSLSRYEKVLKQRNEMLKKSMENGRVDEANFFSWNVLLAKYGVYIRQKREEFLREINSRITDTYRSIAKNKDEIFVKYKNDGVFLEDEYFRKINLDFNQDLVLGYTKYGVHRDSFDFFFNNKLADGSASRGEVRSLILAMKFVEAKIIEKKTGLKPVVLLDDVFSELDETRQKSLALNFKENQVIITSVDGV